MVSSFAEHKTQEREFFLNPSRTAVLVVDMLNDFCTEGGAMVLQGAEKLYGPQNAVISAARAQGAPVVHIVDRHRPNLPCDREFLKRQPHCIEGQWGSEIVAELDHQPQDFVVIKRRYSGFFNTDLDLTLKDLQVDTLVVMGVVTNICVRSTVHDAFFHGYRVVVPHDCVAATGAREQESTLYDIATHFGVISTANSIVDALASEAALSVIEHN